MLTLVWCDGQAATTRAKAVKAVAGVIKADVRLLQQGREQGMVLAAISAALKVRIMSVGLRVSQPYGLCRSWCQCMVLAAISAALKVCLTVVAIFCVAHVRVRVCEVRKPHMSMCSTACKLTIGPAIIHSGIEAIGRKGRERKVAAIIIYSLGTLSLFVGLLLSSCLMDVDVHGTLALAALRRPCD